LNFKYAFSNFPQNMEQKNISCYNKYGCKEALRMEKIYSLEEIKEMLRPIFMTNAVYKAVLFGSYAKGNATNKSDIDIVIDSKGELLNINFYGLLEEIIETLKKKVDLLEISEIKQDSPIYEEIQREGVLLYAK